MKHSIHSVFGESTALFWVPGQHSQGLPFPGLGLGLGFKVRVRIMVLGLGYVEP